MFPKKRIPTAVGEIMQLIESAGGRTFVVGGAVVDLLLDSAPKDWDVEVYGLTYGQLEELLVDYHPKTVGKQFGIIKLSENCTDGLEVDVNVPRRESTVGIGHRDFDIQLDHTMSPKEAARRRDLTINALYYDHVNGEVVDHFGGIEDLRTGTIRATDPSTFIEDPVRVLRVMQLLARKGRAVDPATSELCGSMADTFSSIAVERVHEEFRKLLLKAPKPSVGLNFLKDCGYLEQLPELHAMVDCPENPEWHPEGNTWDHVMNVVDNAARVRDAQPTDPPIPEDWIEPFMWSSLLHDVGKPSVKQGDFSFRGHDTAGEEVATSLLNRVMNGGKQLRERILALVVNHMQPYYLSSGDAGDKAWRRLQNKVRLDVLGWHSRCDGCTKDARDVLAPEPQHVGSQIAWEHFVAIGAAGEKIQPILQGRDLIAAGCNPGPSFGKALEAAYQAQLDGETDDGALLEIALRAI
jgi:tRNA nucleotidyltransferase (CCA-adding enzyme)